MDTNAREITEILKQRISAFAVKPDISETGTVIDVGDGICHAYGLSQVAAGELVEFGNGTKGVAFNLEESTVGIVIMGDATSVREGDLVKRTGQIASVPVGDAMIGRVVDALGNPIDGLGEIKTSERRKIEVKAPGIVARKSVKEPMQTGLKAIDAMTPVGRGQRELIIGDKKTGKSAVAIDTIINQKGNGVICIYVAIGQKRSSVAQVVEKLREYGAMEHTIIVAATASEPAPMTFFAPYAGCAIAEEFMWKGKHVLIVYDDLSKHATAYRAMSLLLRRPPGREAFPGDVFYVHSRLLERAAKLEDKLGGGSITALPVIETLEGAVDAYIPTNVISITDGQIYLQKELFNSGIRPAVNVGISVSRVGGSAQVKGMKKVAGTLRLDLAQYREKQAFAQFGSDLDAATRAQLSKGERLVEILKQDQYKPMPVELQILSIFAVSNGLCDKLPVNQILPFEAGLHAHLLANHKDLMTEFRKKFDLDKDTDAKFTQIIKTFVEQFAAGNIVPSSKETPPQKQGSKPDAGIQPAV